MKKARVYLLLGLVVFCSACAAPSLRYKTDINRMAASGNFKEAADKVEAQRRKNYARQDRALAYLDEAVLLHDAGEAAKSDELLAQAQERIEELYTVSATQSIGRVAINDLTLPYSVSPFERALTYFYRMVNFVDQNNLSDAAVEARRAVLFLDNLRGSKKKGYNDDPFVQYFASLVFESVGQIDDARISRSNALNAYKNLSSLLNVRAPEFVVPSNYNELGEVIILHYNGVLPLKRNTTVQFAWDRVYAILSTAQESQRESLSPQVANALRAGFMGRAVTLAYPVLEQPFYTVTSAFVQTEDGQRYNMQKMADLAAAAKADLDERLPGIWFRAVARAVAKQVAAAATSQAVNSAVNNKDNQVWGDLAGLFVTVAGSAVEKADTRQWFTLPAQIFMTRLFLKPGEQDIRLLLRDGYGNIVAEHTFEKVKVAAGGRVFLHYRTAK
ncbi:hypothetical protein [Candidatus Avelusimicrobium caledoniensis]|uniref:hypothetical protein n=1 Tax=Candidatus Avelusimicrobium caledoniensis TaxID=3416220 RepID=UPI003D0ECF43